MMPFIDTPIHSNRYVRSFDNSVDDSELQWHRDDEDRTIRVLRSDGWMFQFDDEIPFKMVVGQKFKIKKGYWHRVIKGNGSLTLEILKDQDDSNT